VTSNPDFKVTTQSQASLCNIRGEEGRKEEGREGEGGEREKKERERVGLGV